MKFDLIVVKSMGKKKKKKKCCGKGDKKESKRCSKCPKG